MAKKFSSLSWLSVLLFFSATILIHSSAAKAYEKEFTVFDLRKNLALHDGDPVYKDFYVNMGTDDGVQVGSILAVYRHVPVIDIYRNKAAGDLVVPIGHVKVIKAQKAMSVCRIASIASASQIPVVDFETVMMGDQVELAKDVVAEDGASGQSMEQPESQALNQNQYQNQSQARVQADPQPTQVQSQAQAPPPANVPKTLPAKSKTAAVKKAIPVAANDEVQPPPKIPPPAITQD